MSGIMKRAVWVTLCLVVGFPIVVSYGIRWILFGDRAEMNPAEWMERVREKLFKDGGDR